MTIVTHKIEHLMGVAHLRFPRFSSLSSQQGAWQYTGRLGAADVAESPSSCRKQEITVTLS